MKRMVDEPLIDKLKTLTKEINYNKENNTLEIGGNLEVDGSSKLNGLKPWGTFFADSEGNLPITFYCETNEETRYWGFCFVEKSYIGFYYNDGSDYYEIYYMSDDNIIYHNQILIDDNLYEVNRSDEFYLGNFIENVITHSVHVSGQDGDISFNFTSLKNTPIDSIQDLYLYLKNDKIACSGFYEDSNGNKEFVYYLSLGADITNATINNSATKLTEAIGTQLLIRDDVKEIL